MNDRLHKMTKVTKLLVMAPLAIMGMAIFIALGGTVVMLLWNWLAPMLFGWPLITFWQAIGLLALCRILVGGFGLSGRGGHCCHSGKRVEGRIRERVRERMDERWEEMTPEERERMREGLHGRGRPTSPLDSEQGPGAV